MAIMILVALRNQKNGAIVILTHTTQKAHTMLESELPE
jgi:hypothetical protein